MVFFWSASCDQIECLQSISVFVDAVLRCEPGRGTHRIGIVRVIGGLSIDCAIDASCSHSLRDPSGPV